MTTEYWSIHAALPAGAAQRHYCALTSLQWAGTGDPLLVSERDAAEDPFEAVELDLDRYLEIEATAACCEVVQSDGAALLSLIDRAIAVPRGISLLDGRAVAWLPQERWNRLKVAWDKLLDGGGALQSTSRLLTGRARLADLQAELAALGRALSQARLHRLDLLLICSPSPFGDSLEGSCPGTPALDLCR